MSPNGLSLKQWLTALSITPSAPSSPQNYNQSPANSEQQELEMVQEVMAKLIFQAGVDFEHIFGLNASDGGFKCFSIA
uniref:Uncharacterized protein n=1 Tax=Moniliophthora roreri TaxID=221103 RepID=A0A0W0F4Q6_MONRR